MTETLNQNTQKDYYWLNENSRRFLKRDYLKEGVEPEQRIRQIAERAEQLLQEPGFADKFEEYMKRGFYSLATPIWTNFGENRGFPISCFNSGAVPDTMEGILYKAAEVGIQTKNGGGTSAFFGKLRSRGSDISVGGTSSGPVHFMEIYNSISNVTTQGAARRGAFAAYLPVEHPDILEFLKIRSDGHPIQDISIGVTITDEWMKKLLDGDKDCRKIWAAIIKKRYESGYPYLFFTDTANNNAPEVYRKNNRTIYSSNVCSEISLSTLDDESFVCCLSSINLERWDDLKETDAIETLTWFLDAVMEEFIQKSANTMFMEHPRNFAVRQRAIGIGVLGWHSFLQSKMLSFDSMDAKYLNVEIFKTLDNKSLEATKKLADKFGEPELLKGTGLRNTTRLAVAPTTSSSFILGQVSQSIEPLNSNYFVKKLAKGNFTYKNPYLKEVLKNHGQDNRETWSQILTDGGSVQKLKFLTKEEKEVFKTFSEIPQKEIIIQAAQRQKYIDQSQSLNLMIPPNIPPKQVSELLIEAWKMGVKTLYYQRSANPAQQLARSLNSCKSCEG